MTPHLSWAYVACGILFSALAQICLKRAALLDSRQTHWILYIAGSMASYMFAFIAYYLALRHFEISVISPVMTIGVVSIVVLYGMWAGETIDTRHAIGLLLGIAAIFLILSQ